MLTRALYRHSRFTPPKSLSTRKADDAALLFAEGNAPYPDTDSIVTRAGDDYNVWQWDRGRVQDLLGDKTAYVAGDIRPVSLAFEPVDGARQIVTDGGVEAQIWRDDALVATAFRRRTFSEQEWQWFIRTAHGDDAIASTPPAPQQLEPVAERVSSAEAVEANPEWKRVSLASVAAAGILMLATAFQVGQGVFYSASSAIEQTRIVTLAESPGDGVDTRRTRANVNLLRALRTETSQPNPVALLETAIDTASDVGLELSDWSIDTTQVRFGVEVIEGATISDFAALLEANPNFADVIPQIEPERNRTNFRARIQHANRGGQ